VLTVLVIDDNAENRALAKATLEDEGVRAVMAATGEAGVAAFIETQPDCILLDIRMPGLDGIAVCQRIRAMAGGDRVAIIFVTAQRDVETFDRALIAGGDDFITKPFRPAELLVRIQTAMRLRRMAAERSELSTELKRQRDELQRLQLHKEQLSAFVVHDLKNLVNTIELQAQRTLRNPNADERSRDAAAKIHEEARGLMRMITNLLDIGRADEGQLAPIRASFEAGELVQGAVDELRLRASDIGIELVSRVEASSLVADRDLVHRVLINLIENAIRHSPQGTSVDIVARATAGVVELRVADRGPGVPESARATIFERFVSTGNGTNRGLGLAFCKVAVEAHGGRIWVEDGAPGAVFCVRIPDAS
jgi:two-component system sensor histidine kinase/response regulator